MAAQKKTYRVKSAGRVAGSYREEGAIVELTVAQAKYENVIEIGIDLAKGDDETVVSKAPAKRSSRKK